MTEATTVRTPTGAQAVQRALEVLHSFHDNGPDLSASDLSGGSGYPSPPRTGWPARWWARASWSRTCGPRATGSAPP